MPAVNPTLMPKKLSIILCSSQPSVIPADSLSTVSDLWLDGRIMGMAMDGLRQDDFERNAGFDQGSFEIERPEVKAQHTACGLGC